MRHRGAIAWIRRLASIYRNWLKPVYAAASDLFSIFHDFTGTLWSVADIAVLLEQKSRGTYLGRMRIGAPLWGQSVLRGLYFQDQEWLSVPFGTRSALFQIFFTLLKMSRCPRARYLDFSSGR